MTSTRSYYGQPVVKRPEWTWEVPWYFFVGGLAGMCSVVAQVAQWRGARDLATRLRVVAAGGAVISPALLISDLGRPKRFLHMLRVFKPTSAMSVGSWVLAGYGPAASGAALFEALDRFPRLGALVKAAAAILGVPMATYTAVLVADTSIPAWHEARHHLPFLFGASATASAGAVAVLVAPANSRTPGRRLAVGGAVAEVLSAVAMERSLGELGEVYRTGDAGRYQRAATVCSVVGAAGVAAGGRRRLVTAGGAGLILAGSLCQRWAVYCAGFQSAADPAQVVNPQRRRRDGLAAL